MTPVTTSVVPMPVSGDRGAQARTADIAAQIVDFATDAIVSKDREGRLTSWNAGAERLYGYRAQEVLGRPIGFLIPDELNGEEQELLRRVLAGERIDCYETRRMAKDGRCVSVSLTLFALRSEGGEPVGAASIAHDISRQVAAQRELGRSEAGLRQSETFLAGVAASMEEGLLTLDTAGRIATVNDAATQLLGRAQHELLGKTLCEGVGCVGARERECPSDHCRLSQIDASPDRVRMDDETFTRGDGRRLAIDLSAAPLSDGHGASAGQVIVFRDISERKQAAERARRELEQISWIGRVRDAIDEQRLLLAAQPIVSLASNEVVSQELLVRMRDRAGVLVMPGLFLPAAERFGLIGDLDRWVIARAARMAARGVAVNVNLSAQSLGDPELADLIATTFADTHADPSLITFEITETALTKQLEQASKFTTQIGAMGCTFALDDFGTGYGAFTYLKTLPISHLKIDIEFVRDLLDNDASEHLVSATVQLARSFGQKTVAEGAENQETVDRLRELGVDYMQGYFFGRPQLLQEESS
jgi:PAS domain S-box-containing protein